MRTLFVSDMDGTLMGADSRVSAESRKMLNEAISKGALFSVATARTPATVAPLLREVDLRLPAVVMTGAALWKRGVKTSHTDSDTGEYHHVCQMKSTQTEYLIDLYRKHNLPSFIYTLRSDGVIHIRHIGEMNRLERNFMMERIHSPFKKFEIPEDGESSFAGGYPEAALFFSMRPTGQVRPVYDELRDNLLFRPNFYHDMYGSEIALMEVFDPSASKAAAIEILKKETQADRVVAFGDNVNDIPMLKGADVAVAVENAIPEVKEIADIVIGRNTSDAVARFILEQQEAQCGR